MELSDIRHLVTEQTLAFLSLPEHRLLIDNEWVAARSGETFETINPATEKIVGKIAFADAFDVDAAVQAARRALDDGPWSRMRPAERQRLMLKLADLIEANAQTLAELESIDCGKSVGLARAVDMALVIEFFRYMAGWATKIEGTVTETSVPFAPGQQFMTYIRREPVGVVAAVVPWNFPLLVAAWKLGPALAAGCTVVLKPAEQTPLTALFLGRLVVEAGFPPGVVNIVTGDGPRTGAPLVQHTGINKVSFTGSTEVGKRIGHASVDNMTRFTLELGGKSPVIVLDDCDPTAAAQGAANAIFFNQGQVCCAGSRLYVHKKQFDNVVAEVARIADGMRLGSGLDAQAQVNPLVSKEQMRRVSDYIQTGLNQGAKRIAGGQALPDKGFYVRPTVLVDTANDHRVVREEIFGPVLVAMPYDDLDEVAARANDTPYGLGASIWSNDLSRVHKLIPKIKAGTVWVNSHSMLDATMPFGGYKQSGIGRDMGRSALDAYLETKSVWIAL
ncbi:aldehyde dehydrogenase family protein [Ideonella oryzae]|uniref:Aldehyde dehydrogenase family protein n=1 Tax=Ideonella oryzae TaxID=2937441 RepID=A0ABT1BLC6_9BURK|nr:aldehyde dehydrogenase family protein [Ideonella oryzae]MCO5977030.1 aldehyde dehydrogenase family protein [Ideonella oryzae]